MIRGKYFLFGICLLLLCCNNNSIDELVVTTTKSQLENSVIESSKFKDFKSNYAKFDLAVKEIVNKSDREDIEEIANLFYLYVENPVDYRDLLEYKVLSVVGDKSSVLNNMYRDLMKKKEDLISDKEFVSLDEKEKLRLSEWLISVNSKHLNNIPRTKSKTENDECIKCCAEQRDLDIDVANKAAACATAINVTTCLTSAGATALMWWIAEFGIAAARDLAIYHAHESYEICVRGC